MGLDQLRNSMTDKDIEDLIESTKALRLHQETPDPVEALKCIPSLELDDIEKESASIPSKLQEVGSGSNGVKLLSHDMFTNNVVYAELAFDMSSLPAHLVHLLPLFCRSLTEMG